MLGLSFNLDPIEHLPSTSSDVAVEQRLLELLRSMLELDKASLQASTPLASLAIDSLDWVDLLSSVEEEFHVDISHEQTRELACVADLVRLIRELRGG